MGLLMDIKVFNTNLTRFVLVFNHVNMNGIMMKSFFEVSKLHFSLFSTLSFTPKIQMKGALFILWESTSSLSLWPEYQIP